AGMPDAERVIVRVVVCQAGTCSTSDLPSKDPAAGGPGDLLRLEISTGPDGGSCVRARAAATAGRDLSPDWEDLGSPTCFPAPLRYQGLASPSSSWFFGTRHERADAGATVGAADFTGVVAEQADAGAGDAGGDGGAYRDAGS